MIKDTLPNPLMDPVPTLLARTRAELSAQFQTSRPIRLSRAPGRLDVMGGVAEFSGAMVCQAALDRAAAVALQERDDRQLQIFSFNLLDEHRPFTFGMPLDALARQPLDLVRRELGADGRRWAAHAAGCLFVLHEQGYVDLSDPNVKGLSLAHYSTVPAGVGAGSSSAITVAAMMNLRDHFHLTVADGERVARRKVLDDPLVLAALCQRVEEQVVGVPVGVKDPLTSCVGEVGALVRLVCQPHEVQPSLRLPAGVRTIGISSGVQPGTSATAAYAASRCAAFMAHRIILEQMRGLGEKAGRTLVADPMRGYLANLDPDDYKNLFRPRIPEQIEGRDYIDRYGPPTDTIAPTDATATYAVRQAADHHVLEARRIRNFVKHLEQAGGLAGRPRDLALNKAGHLMYASDQSYSNNLLLGTPECELLVRLAREREKHGIYGARITANGGGGTIAVLADEGPRTDAAIAEIITEYQKRTGRQAETLAGMSDAAWRTGTSS